MRIKNVTYPTELCKINKYNDNIDVFVETVEGQFYTMTACTPQFYYSYMEKEGLDYVPASPPDIIVKELTDECIVKALERFCEDDGYWMKAYFLLGRNDGVFSNEEMDKKIKDLMFEVGRGG